ncbi:MAG TPA: hypothetical protein VMV10_21860 [Pirellulales bacterium]|nr:hypothetical protein [Pirellulales bacterium]
MDGNASPSILKSLELDAAHVESLSESDLCALIGFLDYDARLQARLHAAEELAAQDWPLFRPPANRPGETRGA